MNATFNIVAQICNLLYRQSGRHFDARQNAILRYGRVQLCATSWQVSCSRTDIMNTTIEPLNLRRVCEGSSSSHLALLTSHLL
jgi:hypothetical protein